MKLLHKYKETSYGTKQKEDFLDDLLSWFNANQPWYLNNEEPWLTMQLFVQMATMHLTVLREQAFYWNKVYGPEDKHVDAEKHKKELNDAIADYKNHTDKIRPKCMEWRMSKISRTQWQREGHNPFNQYSVCRVDDDFSGFHREYNDNQQSHFPERDYQNLRDYVDIGYREQIELYLSLASIWPSFAIEQKANLATVMRRGFMESGIAGNGHWFMSHFNDREFYLQHGPITKVEIHAWDGVDGIEVWYGGQSPGLRGKKGGSVRTLDIAPGESITRVAGRITTVVDSIKFQVNTNKKIGGGGNRGGYPTSPDTFNIGADTENSLPCDLRLAYLYGWASGDADVQGRGFVQQLGAVFEGADLVSRALSDDEARNYLAVVEARR